MKDSILFTKSKAFALRVVRLYKYLRALPSNSRVMFSSVVR